MNWPAYRKRYRLGAVLGAVLLGLGNATATYLGLLLAQFLVGAKLGSVLAPLVLWRFAFGMGWGCILGWRIAEAVTAYRMRDRKRARRILFDTGWQGTATQILLVPFSGAIPVHALAQALTTFFNLTNGDGRAVTCYFMSNLCLQVTFLMVLAGRVLPLEEDKTVQVTEKLRL